MKRKIIGIFVCILLIATAVPAVKSLKDSKSSLAILKDPLPIPLDDWTQIQKLLAGDGAAGDDFGNSVSIYGDTALIGTPQLFTNTGSAYVFTRTGTTWTQQQKLLASDGSTGDYFGFSVSLYGDTALIGAVSDYIARGAAYVFTRSGTTWTQQQKLLASDGVAEDNFGCSVSLYGDIALIGATGDNNVKGSAYVFTRTGTTWTEQQKLLALDGATNDHFGNSASLDDDTALIGAYYDDSSKGAAYVFTRTGTTWTQQQKLLASDGTAGDRFGNSVSLNSDTAIIGANYDNSSKGAAYVFTRTGTTWTPQQKLLASDGVANDRFGNSVSLDSDTALIGAFGDDSSKGSAYVFTRTGTTWTQQQKLTASDGATNDVFGKSVSLDSDTALIGAFGDDSSKGSAYVFTKESDNQPPNTPSNPNPANQANGVSTTTDLSWTGGDPDLGDTVTYNVYFGTTNPPPKVVTNQSAITYDPGTLNPLTKYYWKIKAWDNHGAYTIGPVWSFTTQSTTNHPPNKPQKPTGPTTRVTGQQGTYWANGTDPDGDKIKYRFDWNASGSHSYSAWTVLVNSGTKLSMEHSWTKAGTYVVKVQSRDEHGALSVWSNGLTVTVTVNHPPNQPKKPTGPTTRLMGQQGTYWANGTDPDGDKIQYRFDWDAAGAHQYSSWTSLVNSGTKLSKNHAWTSPGTYVVKVQSRDEHGVKSVWSNGLTVIVHT
jgi:hypothetical protein